MKCFHHNDLDGRCAGAIVSYFMDNMNPDDFIEVDYTNVPDADSVQHGEDVFIVDYCFTDSTVYQLQAIVAKGCHVIWIDHHKSSADLLMHKDQYAFMSSDKLRIVVDTKLCGAALTYMYFNYEVGRAMPMFLKYVDDWDRWVGRYPETYKFKLGVESIKHSPTDTVWRDLLNMDSYDVLDKIIHDGNVVERYTSEFNAQYCNQFVFKCVLKGLKCYALNIRLNSKVFGDLIKQCDAVVTFIFNGDIYQYSIYSANPDVDCAKVAEMYGGGGHKGAAGFSSDKLVIERSDWS